MFTDRAQAIIDLAKDHVCGSVGPSGELTVTALLAAVGHRLETAAVVAECFGVSRDRIRAACPELVATTPCRGKLDLSDSVRAIVLTSRELGGEVPDRSHPGLVDARHLVGALALSREACDLLGVDVRSRKDVVGLLTAWYDRDLVAPHLDELTERLKRLRSDLEQRIFGQDHAVHAFVEGLFSAEVVAGADTTRTSPRAVFVFAGPPGVGKTFMAELGATCLQRPFKRFDMSGFSGHHQGETLVGMSRSYLGAHPGLLTEFVEKAPAAVLLFDEIEKAHRNTIHLFLQILDAGSLEDKYHERNVSFAGTTIIFTTNAGRSLYDRPNATGVHAINASFHRRTILDALESEKDPLTREPFFPAALCSRLATGYPVLFKHLGVRELERVATAELARVGTLIERQYCKSVTLDPLVALCLVLREGVHVDARTVRSQAESFVKTELFKFCQLFKTDRLEEMLKRVDAIDFRLEDRQTWDGELRDLLELAATPRILLVAGREICELYSRSFDRIGWQTATTREEALQILAEREVDVVLLDLWLGCRASTATIEQFDHLPVGARSLDRGQELLRRIRERMPDLPVFIVSIDDQVKDGGGTVDDEVFLACVRAGGARGVLHSAFVGDQPTGWETERDQFGVTLTETVRQLHREKKATALGDQRKVLAFETVPRLDEARRRVTFYVRRLRLTQAVRAADVGEVLDEVERPVTRFSEVIGAATAKEELQFFIDYLRTPRRFAALGLKPPRGVLLHGPAGTGKTMLARAMAGESNVAFIPLAATSFVTIWQGSGPQNVRDLFGRARRYAPSIIFIDEIDAIGKTRVGLPGQGAEETTLNALLTEMDGFVSPSALRPVFLLAATNFHIDGEAAHSPGLSARTLDPALVRRFDRCILVDLPDRDARRQFLSLRFEGRPNCTVTPEIIERLAGRSAGMSIANLEAIADTAARAAAKRSSIVSDELIEEAFESARHGDVAVWAPDLLERIARHEAGHVIMYWLSGWWPTYVTVVGRSQHGGYMERDPADTSRQLKTRDELLAGIRVALGGRGAELVFYAAAGFSTGARADLEAATRQARDMTSAYGMDEELGPIAVGDLMGQAPNAAGPLILQVNEAVGKMLKDEMARTLEHLRANRHHLERVAQALVEKNRLTRKELEKILPPLGTVGTSGSVHHSRK